MIRKTMALVAMLVAALVLGGGATEAYAASPTGSISLASDTKHDLVAYQILDGNVASDGSVSDIVWGSGISERSQDYLERLQGLEVDGEKPFAGVEDARGFARALDLLAYDAGTSSYRLSPDTEKEACAKAAARAAQGLLADGMEFSGREAGSSASGLDGGWYIVASERAEGADADTILFPSLIAVGTEDVRVTPKEAAPTLEKSVMEDSDGTWGKIADAETGEEIPYRIDLTLPDMLGGCESVWCKITDILPQGMAVDLGSVKVMSGDLDLTELFETALDGEVMTLEAQGLEKLGLAEGAEITVTYGASLTEGACVGDGGSVNTAYCELVADGESVTTPPSRTAAMTYGLSVKKVSSEDHGTLLSGAKFVLARADGEFAAASEGYVTGWVEDVSEATVFVTGDDGEFAVYGLDSDEYVLVEAQAPQGYALNMKDLAFSVDATVSFDVAGQEGKIETIELKGNGSSSKGDAKFGMVYAAIENVPKEGTPSSPSAPGPSAASGTTPKTGDATPVLTPLAVCGGVFVVGALALVKHKEKEASDGQD